MGTYVYSVYIVKKHQKKKKKKKKSDVLPSGGLFLGTELIPLFPYLRAGLSKKGGEASRLGPVNRFLLTDHSLKGLDNLGSTQALSC